MRRIASTGGLPYRGYSSSSSCRMKCLFKANSHDKGKMKMMEMGWWIGRCA